MFKFLEKIYDLPIPILIIAGIGLSVFLCYTMMVYAEAGDLSMVIVCATAVSIVALMIGKAIRSKFFKEP